MVDSEMPARRPARAHLWRAVGGLILLLAGSCLLLWATPLGLSLRLRVADLDQAEELGRRYSSDPAAQSRLGGFLVRAGRAQGAFGAFDRAGSLRATGAGWLG